MLTRSARAQLINNDNDIDIHIDEVIGGIEERVQATAINPSPEDCVDCIVENNNASTSSRESIRNFTNKSVQVTEIPSPSSRNTSTQSNQSSQSISFERIYSRINTLFEEVNTDRMDITYNSYHAEKSIIPFSGHDPHAYEAFRAQAQRWFGRCNTPAKLADLNFIIQSKLRGPAKLLVKSERDIEGIIALLDQKYQAKEKTHLELMEELRKIKQRPTQSVNEYAEEILIKTKEILETPRVINSFDYTMEVKKLGADQFVRNLTKEIRSSIHFLGSEYLEQLVLIAKTKEKQLKWNEEHDKNDDYNELKKEMAELRDSFSRETIHAMNSNNICQLCDKHGHTAKNCSNQRNKDDRECNKCGWQGHIARDCFTKVNNYKINKNNFSDYKINKNKQ